MAASNQNEIKTKIDEALKKSGEIDRIKNILRTRLSECGWKDEIRLECRNIIQEKGLDDMTVDSLVKDVTPLARERLPASVKKELLQQIQNATHQQIELLRMKHDRFQK